MAVASTVAIVTPPIPIFVVIIAGVVLAGIIFIGGLLLARAGSIHREQRASEFFYRSVNMPDEYMRR
ncbi:MAG TPA: hypothetical protein VFU49_12080 [Ktedonobacteraceae bacterium]|nr:hypothetical protein [Ktedonobacteraceae bacterium]